MNSRRPRLKPSSDSQIRLAVKILHDSMTLGARTACDAWDFSTTLSTFRKAGVSEGVLRWLMCREYVEHAVECTGLSDPKRVFRESTSLGIFPRSCFVLTKDGVDFLTELKRTRSNGDGSDSGVRGAEAVPHERPYWEESTHTLFWHECPVKRYRSEAPNQEAVLRQFQIQDWVACIPVSLALEHGINPKERLRETIKSINRNVRSSLRFCQEGCGSRVRWYATDR